jgi:hypothetical protein
MGGRSVAFSSHFCLSFDHHSCLWLRTVHPGHILMFILVASHRRQVATRSRVDCSCLLVHTHTHTKKIKFAPISRMVVVTRQFVTNLRSNFGGVREFSLLIIKTKLIFGEP